MKWKNQQLIQGLNIWLHYKCIVYQPILLFLQNSAAIAFVVMLLPLLNQWPVKIYKIIIFNKILLLPIKNIYIFNERKVFLKKLILLTENDKYWVF